MIQNVAGTAFYQASFEALDRALELLGALVVGFVVVFLVYVLVLGRRGWPGRPIRTLVGALGGLALVVLGLLAAAVAMALLAPALYLSVVVVVLACFGSAAWLLWRHYAGTTDLS